MHFPAGLFTDVRYESVYNTTIAFENGDLKQNKTSLEEGAFIRVFDGQRWYYSATTDLSSVQAEIDGLAALASPNEDILDHPVVKRLEANRDVCLRYEADSVIDIPNEDKLALLQSYVSVYGQLQDLQTWKAAYFDTHTKKQIISSLGADVTFDYQRASVVLGYTFGCSGTPFSSHQHIYRDAFSDLRGQQDLLLTRIREDWDYAHNAVAVEPGVYTCILSPSVAGVFAHESFGHKSESDFMIGDETMAREWALGTKVGSEILNILDSGIPTGSGYMPYDDEGTRAKETYLIKNGILTGRLHSAYTAAALVEDTTGNARAINFEFEPIVRMTSTYIGAGTQTKEALFAGVKDGLYIKDCKHGSGMSTFTIAPSVAYRIRDGKLAEPVRVAVITGNVMKTLHEIDGLSKDLEIISSSTGGCGKMEQYPLRVAFGGPYVRVNGIHVQ